LQEKIHIKKYSGSKKEKKLLKSNLTCAGSISKNTKATEQSGTTETAYRKIHLFHLKHGTRDYVYSFQKTLILESMFYSEIIYKDRV